MKKLSILLVLIVTVLILVPGVFASDLFKIEIKQNQITPWWIHCEKHMVWQLYGTSDWLAFCLGPERKIGSVSIRFPLGIRTNVCDERLPITHLIAKANAVGKVGPFDILSINDFSYGRKGNPNILYLREQILWKGIGLAMEGLKIGDKNLKAYIGPVIRWSKKNQQLWCLLGASDEDKTVRLTYLLFF